MKRWIVAVGLFASVSALLVWRSCSRSEPRIAELVVLSYGGEFADAQRAAYFAPFTKATGTRVVEAAYNGEYGKLKAAVESGTVPWDVVDLESSALLRGVRDSILQPIDPSQLHLNDLLPAAIHSHGIATDFYSVSLAYNTRAFPPGPKRPSSWRDFWDVKAFPGPRCLKRDPRFTLEIALLADGVDLKDVYASGRLDVDRAFRSLDRIKPYVKVWWTSGQQPIQLLSDGEVAMVAAFGARLFNASNEGKPVAVSWNEGIVDTEYWTIPRGAKNVSSALAFIAFASRPDRQAEFAMHIPLGPVNRKTFEVLPTERAVALNTHPNNYDKQLLLNARFWAMHEEAVRERFNQWLTQ